MLRLRWIVSILVILLVAACGGSDESEPSSAPAAAATDTFRVEMRDIYFGENSNNMNQPPVWTVASGDEISMELVNLGNLEHNWAVVKKGAEVPVPYTGGPEQEALLYYAGEVVAAGQTETHTFTAPAEVGEYLVICTVAGHYPAMQGKLQVQ